MPACGPSFLKLNLSVLSELSHPAGNACMHSSSKQHHHQVEHAAKGLGMPVRPPHSDLIRVGSRRWFLQAGLAGLGGLSLASLNPLQAATAAAKPANRDKKSVILFWLSGGPSHIDMW